MLPSLPPSSPSCDALDDYLTPFALCPEHLCAAVIATLSLRLQAAANQVPEPQPAPRTESNNCSSGCAHVTPQVARRAPHAAQQPAPNTEHIPEAPLGAWLGQPAPIRASVRVADSWDSRGRSLHPGWEGGGGRPGHGPPRHEHLGAHGNFVLGEPVMPPDRELWRASEGCEWAGVGVGGRPSEA